MRAQTVCKSCGSREIEYLGNDECFCFECNKKRDAKTIFVESPYERTRRGVYATGNRWAIENWKATHE